MIVESVRVKNYRSIKEEILYLNNLTVLVGPNGVGKSTFLRALEIFYSPSPQIDSEDFFNNEVTEEISIAVTFTKLSEEAKQLFTNYIQGTKLTVERVIAHSGEGKYTLKYHGSALQNPDFLAIRNAGKATEKKLAYQELLTKPEYKDFSKWQNEATTLLFLKEWEGNNSDKCTRQRDDGQFFGFKEVAQGYLGKYSKFLLIPAVKDAAIDATEGKGTILTVLMDMVVRNVLAGKEAVVSLKSETQSKYEEILDPAKLAELKSLQNQLTSTLKTFVPNASINLDWLPLGKIDIPMPQADVKLLEDGFSTSVNNTGHGLQRAFILTMLQHLAFANLKRTEPSENKDENNSSDNISMPSFLLAIEEPELYQHPNRQRHLAKVLLQLASGRISGVADTTQVIYGTHSPLFVGVDRFDEIRLLKKVPTIPDKPKKTKIITASLENVAQLLWEADGAQGTVFTAETLIPRLKSLMTPWINEGFFAELVVLVEGEDDCAALQGMFLAKDIDPETLGISIIPCGGKNNLDRPSIIFRQLGIPVYMVWDGDNGVHDAKPEDNHRLLRLNNVGIEDWPSIISDNCACFKQNLEKTICQEIGEEYYEALLDEFRNELKISKKKHAIKNPLIVSKIIRKALEDGKNVASLNDILERIITLRSSQIPV